MQVEGSARVPDRLVDSPVHSRGAPKPTRKYIGRESAHDGFRFDSTCHNREVSTLHATKCLADHGDVSGSTNDHADLRSPTIDDERTDKAGDCERSIQCAQTGVAQRLVEG